MRSDAEEAGKSLAFYEQWGGQLIAEHRQKLGLTQREFAERLGVTNVSLSFVENGHRNPLPTLKKIHDLKAGK